MPGAAVGGWIVLKFQCNDVRRKQPDATTNYLVSFCSQDDDGADQGPMTTPMPHPAQ